MSITKTYKISVTEDQIKEILAGLDERALTLTGRIRSEFGGNPENMTMYRAQLAAVESAIDIVRAAA